MPMPATPTMLTALSAPVAPSAVAPKCACGNALDEDCTSDACDYCSWAAEQPPHVGHRALLSGAWWCDTCNSGYCELA